jgi:2-iminoacetate synthase
MTFEDESAGLTWEAVGDFINSRSAEDVRRALDTRSPGLEEAAALLSPAAAPFLEEMAGRAHDLTVQRFGRAVGLFAPLYLSNVCTNSCLYCGFSARNSAERLTLTVDEAEEEARLLHGMGFRHILLVSGEAPQQVPVEYLVDAARRLRPIFSSISI